MRLKLSSQAINIRFGVVDLFHGIHGVQSIDTGIWWVVLLFPGVELDVSGFPRIRD